MAEISLLNYKLTFLLIVCVCVFVYMRLSVSVREIGEITAVTCANKSSRCRKVRGNKRPNHRTEKVLIIGYLSTMVTKRNRKYILDFITYSSHI